MEKISFAEAKRKFLKTKINLPSGSFASVTKVTKVSVSTQTCEMSTQTDDLLESPELVSPNKISKPVVKVSKSTKPKSSVKKTTKVILNRDNSARVALPTLKSKKHRSSSSDSDSEEKTIKPTTSKTSSKSKVKLVRVEVKPNETAAS